jgi:hypothetical protein
MSFLDINGKTLSIDIQLMTAKMFGNISTLLILRKKFDKVKSISMQILIHF